MAAHCLCLCLGVAALGFNDSPARQSHSTAGHSSSSHILIFSLSFLCIYIRDYVNSLTARKPGIILSNFYITVEPPNNGHVGDEHFVHCSDVVPSSEVEMYGQYVGRG